MGGGAALPARSLLTATLDVAPVPWLVDEAASRLVGHAAIQNRVVQRSFGQTVAVVFQGPDAYVTPTWYAAPSEQVPTWNYVLARAEGVLVKLSAEETGQVLWRLCERFEAPDGFRPSWLKPADLDEMLTEIVGIAVDVTSFTAKLKLSQNRTPEDRERVVAGLGRRGAPADVELLRWMRGELA